LLEIPNTACLSTWRHVLGDTDTEFSDVTAPYLLLAGYVTVFRNFSITVCNVLGIEAVNTESRAVNWTICLPVSQWIIVTNTPDVCSSFLSVTRRGWLLAN